ncbi:type VI secretion protein [Comamonas sp. E6]|nr:type VI secretion protein [Comamonas sp. E6]
MFGRWVVNSSLKNQELAQIVKDIAANTVGTIVHRLVTDGQCGHEIHTVEACSLTAVGATGHNGTQWRASGCMTDVMAWLFGRCFAAQSGMCPESYPSSDERHGEKQQEC